MGRAAEVTTLSRFERDGKFQIGDLLAIVAPGTVGRRVSTLLVRNAPRHAFASLAQLPASLTCAKVLK